MNNQEAYNLQVRIRKESPELIAVYCLRSLKGPIGKKPWQVDAHLPTGEPIRFRTVADYESYSKAPCEKPSS